MLYNGVRENKVIKSCVPERDEGVVSEDGGGRKRASWSATEPQRGEESWLTPEGDEVICQVWWQAVQGWWLW